ncbi:MAG TPA: hypothetical protein PLL76_23165 [Thermoanaerobaculia bacterium]|nr:hypothetical protein [Thermoanaerobaculia bacterium]
MPTDEEKETVSVRKPGSTVWLQLNLTPEGPDDKSRAANDELRQMLLTALQMQHMIVLAGSGCSIVAGGPTMTALWDAAVGDPPKPASATIAKKVGHAPDKKDIEALLSRMEAYLQVQEDASIREALNGSKKVILDRCSTFLDTAKLETHRTFLHRLSRRRVRDERLKVFTTNYDLCFEAATADIGGSSSTASRSPRHEDTTRGSSDTTSSAATVQAPTPPTTSKASFSFTSSTDP